MNIDAINDDNNNSNNYSVTNSGNDENMDINENEYKQLLELGNHIITLTVTFIITNITIITITTIISVSNTITIRIF